MRYVDKKAIIILLYIICEVGKKCKGFFLYFPSI